MFCWLEHASFCVAQEPRTTKPPEDSQTLSRSQPGPHYLTPQSPTIIGYYMMTITWSIIWYDVWVACDIVVLDVARLFLSVCDDVLLCCFCVWALWCAACDNVIWCTFGVLCFSECWDAEMRCCIFSPDVIVTTVYALFTVSLCCSQLIGIVLKTINKETKLN